MSSLVLPSQKIDNIDLVIFDKDGTLIDVHHYWCSMIEFRAQFFIDSLQQEEIDHEKLYNALVDAMGIDLKTKKMKAEGPVGIKPRAFIVTVALQTLSQYIDNYTQQMVEDIFAQVDEYSKTQIHKIIKPLDGVKELLEKLKRNKVLIAIATTDLSTRAKLAMKELDCETYFDIIAGADLVENAKPSPDLVNYIASQLNIATKNIVVFGDSMADLNMAQNSGSLFIGVKSGLYTDEFIKQSQYLIEDLTQVEVG